MSLTMNPPPLSEAVEIFLSRVDFTLPEGYERFIRSSNGAEGFLKNAYVILWPIEDLFTHNEGYRVEEYAPGFFIIGSDGGGTSYAVDKQTGALYEMPFIGMSREEASWVAKDFDDFIDRA
ncbi:SMI1 / KNR4 family (SUKH-1) [Chryseolinea serpens]|uniref:SMI1 / KNR4 family (SUKH-1) n=1 Tax=Chryseolinea serpens TaxID=947013 RepID=A0A1M5TXP0_9BACT|nr:SMI1/KNR4 family protein [Chryseolinea serpens]SHH55595.1 SMI1 / KNR4 family (SUKH-1) [Chryseolinea serpens]